VAVGPLRMAKVSYLGRWEVFTIFNSGALPGGKLLACVGSCHNGVPAWEAGVVTR
jgi:hypothetical protein